MTTRVCHTTGTVFVLDDKLNLPHKIIIDERKNLNISGVSEVKNFDDETLMLDTVLGSLTVKGDGMRIVSFNTQTGDLIAEGKIHAVAYSSDTVKGGFFSRIFR